MPTTEVVLEMMTSIREMGESLAASLPQALESPDLSLDQATRFLETCVRFQAGLDMMYSTIEMALDDDALTDEMESDVDEFTETAHELGKRLTMQCLVRVRDLGGNANLLLDQFQRAHYKG